MVKWVGEPYSRCSFESIEDIVNASCEYEEPLRAFFRREQRRLEAAGPGRRRLEPATATATSTVPPSPSSLLPLPGGLQLRDYQVRPQALPNKHNDLPLLNDYLIDDTHI
jgi:hypothetical protein